MYYIEENQAFWGKQCVAETNGEFSNVRLSCLARIGVAESMTRPDHIVQPKVIVQCLCGDLQHHFGSWEDPVVLKPIVKDSCKWLQCSVLLTWCSFVGSSCVIFTFNWNALYNVHWNAHWHISHHTNNPWTFDEVLQFVSNCNQWAKKKHRKIVILEIIITWWWVCILKCLQTEQENQSTMVHWCFYCHVCEVQTYS